jgi:hypothetical protein
VSCGGRASFERKSICMIAFFDDADEMIMPSERVGSAIGTTSA